MSLKKWVPRDTSGTNPSCIKVSSQITEAVLISANETGTPSDGIEVPQRPGPMSMIVRSRGVTSAIRVGLTPDH